MTPSINLSTWPWRQSPDLDVNWTDPHGNCSLLQYACAMGYEDVTKELLARGADATHMGPGGVSCLATALAHSWPNCAAQLLAAKADANEQARQRDFSGC